MSKILSIHECYAPSRSIFNKQVTIMTVLVAGNIDDYAAYRGVVTGPMNDPDDVQWVASVGNKIPFEEANNIFTNLTQEKYRS